MWLTLELLDAAHNYKPKLESKLEGGVISLKNESNNEQMDLMVSEGGLFIERNHSPSFAQSQCAQTLGTWFE